MDLGLKVVVVVVVVDRTCVVGHRNLPYKANLKMRYMRYTHQHKLLMNPMSKG